MTDDHGEQFVFLTYVAGSYFDSKESSESTAFMFMHEA